LIHNQFLASSLRAGSPPSDASGPAGDGGPSCARGNNPLRSAQAAAGRELFAGQPAGVVEGEEDRDVGDVVRLADAAERGVRDEALQEVRACEALGALGLDGAGIDRIDPC